MHTVRWHVHDSMQCNHTMDSDLHEWLTWITPSDGQFNIALVSLVGTNCSDHMNASTMPGIDFTLQHAGIGTAVEDKFFLNGLTRQGLRPLVNRRRLKKNCRLVGEGCVHSSMEFFNENIRFMIFMIPWVQLGVRIQAPLPLARPFCSVV